MKRQVLSAVLLVGLMFAAILAAPLLAANTSYPKEPSHRVCFPKERWGPAPDRDRPCVYVDVLYEDGTWDGEVRQADGDAVNP